MVNKIFSAPYGLLECPRWDSFNDLLWFVSINERLVIAIDEGGKVVYKHCTTSEVSFISIEDKNSIMYAETNGFYRLDLMSKATEKIFGYPMQNGKRFNDGIIDASGRVIIGTKSISDTTSASSELLSFNKDHTVTVLLDELEIPNGMAFSADGRYLYFSESSHHKVYRYGYNPDDGSLTSKEVFIEFPDDVFPDGLAMSRDAYLWVAEWGGAAVSCWDSLTGKVIHRLALEDRKVSSCAIGGTSGELLFITTALDQNEHSTGANVYLFRLDDL